MLSRKTKTLGITVMVKRLDLGDWFIIGIVCLQALAVLSYTYKKRWLEALVYGCYMTAQIALLAMSLRGR